MHSWQPETPPWAGRGQQLNLGAHAVIGQTFMACADLVEVAGTLVRYGPLLTGSNTELSRYEDPVNDRAGLMLSLDLPSLSRRFSHEAIFSAAQKTISDLLQMPTADLEVHFPYAPPPRHNAADRVSSATKLHSTPIDAI